MADAGQKRTGATMPKAPRPQAGAPAGAPDPTVDTDILNQRGEPETLVTDTRGGREAAIHAVPSAGDRIAKYVVERVIGSGGMGLVVAARNEQLNELVAIKLLRPKAAGDKVHAERFAREARAIIKIKSEHVVRVLDAGTLDSGAPYIVMEYLVGRDLSQIVREEGAMHFQKAADYMLQICEAAASAHAVGVVHRDLKPSNFFVTTRADGTTLVKVLDFGISKAIHQEGLVDPNLTETQAVFGSPTYMSPEQIRSAKHVDHRSDVWSLGVCFYELVTGKLPFAADNVAGLLASVIADPPYYPRAFAPDLPEALEELLLHCLAKDVRQRVQSAAELAFRLAPFATPTAETHSLLDRIDRLARAGGQSATTGPRLPAPPPGPQPPPAHLVPADPPPPRMVSQPSFTSSDGRTSGIAFGSTGMDLAGDTPNAVRRRGTVVGIGIGAGVALLLVGGIVGGYQLKSRRTPPPAATEGPVASESPPPHVSAAPPPPASAPIVIETPPSSASLKPAVSAPPTSRKPPKHVPKPIPAAPSTKPVDPTGDRF